MIAAQVDDGLITTITGVGITATIALMAWIVRELYRISSLVSKIDERTMDHERRIENLERYKGAP